MDLSLSTKTSLRNDKGDIIEIYNPEGVQIYRNFEFFKHVSYSFTELFANEWHVLYERPAFVIEKLIETHQKVKLGEISTTTEYGIADHIVKERYLQNRKVFKVKMKFVSPLRDKSTGLAHHTISTMSSELYVEGNDSLKLDFI